jgi:hypothetical protein
MPTAELRYILPWVERFVKEGLDIFWVQSLLNWPIAKVPTVETFIKGAFSSNFLNYQVDRVLMVDGDRIGLVNLKYLFVRKEGD